MQIAAINRMIDSAIGAIVVRDNLSSELNRRDGRTGLVSNESAAWFEPFELGSEVMMITLVSARRESPLIKRASFNPGCPAPGLTARRRRPDCVATRI